MYKSNIKKFLYLNVFESIDKWSSRLEGRSHEAHSQTDKVLKET